MESGRAIALLLQAGYPYHRDTPDDSVLEEGLEYENQH